MDERQRIDAILDRYRGTRGIRRALLKTRFISLPLEELHGLLPHDAVIAEPGCGHGVLAHYLKLRSPEREITGCDISEKRIRTAQNSVGDIEGLTFFTGDITRPETMAALRREDRPLHIVISQVLYLFSREQAVSLLAAVAAAMNPDDVLWLIDYTTRPRFPYAWIKAQNVLLTLLCRFFGKIAPASLSNSFGSRSRFGRIPSEAEWEAIFEDSGLNAGRIPCKPLVFVPTAMFRCRPANSARHGEGAA